MIFQEISARLEDLDRRTLLRQRLNLETVCGPEVVIDGRRLAAFCSNDYLGLAADPRLIAAVCEGAERHGVGSGASHLVSGHFSAHEALEKRIAAFVGMPRALSFSTGYMANLAVLPTLAEAGDAVFCDALNHASLIDAARLTRAERHVYPHVDIGELAGLMEASTARRKLVVTDSVFSMDGDLAPLAEIFALCEQHDAWLLVDDAHGFGVLGPQGRGALAHHGIASPRVIVMGTLGKAAGVAGAFVAGNAELIEWLLQRARSYIFTTAAPPMLAHALLVGLDIIESEDHRRRQLADHIALFRRSLMLSRWSVLPSATAIQPVIIGDNAEAMQVAAALMDAGIWVRAIRPPTVAEGTARLRITLCATHTAEQVVRLAETLNALEQRGQQ